MVRSSGGSFLPEAVSAVASAAFLLAGVVFVVLTPNVTGAVAGGILATGSFIALLSLALTLVLRAARMDLSVAAVAALGGVLAAKAAAGGSTLLAGLVVAVVVGAGVGLLNGLVGSLSRGAAYVVTFGTAGLAQAVSYAMATQAIAIAIPGGGLGAAGGTAALVLAALVAAAAVVLLIITPAGAALDARADDDERSGGLGGPLVAAFVGAGVLAALAGVLQTAWFGIASPLTASGTSLLLAIAAALIGGSSLRGRSGAGYAAVLASFAMAALLAGLQVRDVSGTVMLGIAGGVVVLAVLWSEVRSRLFA